MPLTVKQTAAALNRDVATVRRWVAQGCPTVSGPGSVGRGRDPLVWLGCADPVDTQEQECDDDLGPLRAAFGALHATFPGEFTSRQISQHCREGYGEETKTLKEAIEAAGCQDVCDAKKVGFWLRGVRDRVAGPLKMKHREGAHGIAKWKVEPI